MQRVAVQLLLLLRVATAGFVTSKANDCRRHRSCPDGMLCGAEKTCKGCGGCVPGSDTPDSVNNRCPSRCTLRPVIANLSTTLRPVVDTLSAPHFFAEEHPVWINYVTAKFGIDAAFKESVMKHAAAVEGAHVFNKTYAYYELPDFALHDPRFKRHIKFLKMKNDASKRGGGYWFWKPLIVGKLLEGMGDGEVLVYGDNDRDDFVPTIRRIVKVMADNQLDFGITHRDFSDRAVVFSKGDIFEEFYPNVPYEQLHIAAKQIHANLFVVRNSEQVRNLFAAWVRCVSIWQLVSDEPSRRPNHPDFKENRHDQALLSLLLQSKGLSAEIPGRGLLRRAADSQPKRHHRHPPHTLSPASWGFYNIGDSSLAPFEMCTPPPPHERRQQRQ